MYKYGFDYVWEQQDELDNNKFTSFLSEFKSRLQDEFYQNNIEMFRNAPKARLYKAIYTKHETPWYLDNVNSMSRHLLTKIRLGSHHLVSETGSLALPKILYSERKCMHCSVLGDVYHQFYGMFKIPGIA